MQKLERQNTLIELIGLQPVGSQSELASLLEEKGFKATQASISRDLDELGVSKQDGRYVFPARARGGSEFGSVLMTTAGDSLIVARCRSGVASAVTVDIDAARIPGVVGTIAGDDTIFIAVDGQDRQISVLETLKAMFE